MTVSTGCRDHLQRRSGTFTVKSRISFVLRQLLVGRAPRSQLIAQFPRVLRTFSKFSHLFDKKIQKSGHNFRIILRLHLALNAILNRKNNSYVSLIHEIPLISKISTDWRILVEAPWPRSRSLRLRWTFNRVMMSSGSRSTLVRCNIFMIKHVRLTSSNCMLMRGHGVHARRTLATRSVLVNLSSRLDSVK